MVTKVVHELKLLQLPKSDDRSLTMARVITIYQKFHNCSPSVTEDIEIPIPIPPIPMFQSNEALSESYDNFMLRSISGFELEIKCSLAKVS